MNIIWDPLIRRNSCEHLGVRWEYQEVKEIPDDLKIRINVDNEVHYIELTACLLGNADFKEAGTGVNPHFQCSDCGKETREEGTFNRFSGDTIEFVRDGLRVCSECFTHAPAIEAVTLDPEPAEVVAEEHDLSEGEEQIKCQ